MRKITLTLPLAGALAAIFAACSMEEVVDESRSSHPITFNVGFGTRGPEITIANLDGFLVTAYQNGATGHMEADGKIPEPFFENEPFIGNNTQFTSLNAKDWPAGNDPVEFFAYFPNLTSVRKTYSKYYAPLFNMESSDSAYINFYNYCTDDFKNSDPVVVEGGTSKFNFDPSKMNAGYKLARYYIPFDISEHQDFITAHYFGKKNEDELTGVNLTFKHQLSQIELRGICESLFYDVEVAGVRIGNPIVAGAMFNFCGSTPGILEDKAGGKWEYATNPLHHPVEYIYQGGEDGDFILSLNPGNPLVSEEPGATAASKSKPLMGNGGNAMVLPTTLRAWDPEIDDNAAQKDRGMYFSVLMRVMTKPTATDETITQIFPYKRTDKRKNLHLVFFAVDKTTGQIATRLYYKNGNYYEWKTQARMLPESKVKLTPLSIF